MAVVTITIEDREDGRINVKSKIDPPIKKNQGHFTPAQKMGVTMMHTALINCDEISEETEE